MTKEEALKKIEELKEFVKQYGRQVGFNDDEIFLLSAEEYEKYKDKIPCIYTWWWLRSPAYNSDYVSRVNPGCSVCYDGCIVTANYSGVRPAIKLKNEYGTGRRVIIADFPWIVIDTHLAIAEVPIVFRNFDSASNDYETSEIRKFLKDWYEERM